MIWSFPDLVRKHPWFENYFVQELNDDAYHLSTTMPGGHNLENLFKATIEIFSKIGIKSWLDSHPSLSNRLTLFLYLDLDDPRWIFKKLKYS
jgi:hypothetical protein